MKITEDVQKIEKKIIKVICDLCGKEIDEAIKDDPEEVYVSYDIDIDLREHSEYYNDQIRSIKVDCCRKCFKEKILPLCQNEIKYEEETL